MTDVTYFIKKTLITVALIFATVSGLFFMFRLMPGDFTTFLIAEGASPESVARLEEKWNLAGPLHEQYFAYLQNMMSGDVGESFRFREPVTDIVFPAIINSAILVAPAITTTYILGALIGAKMGLNRGSSAEKSGIIPLTIIGTTPEFFTGIMFLVIFSYWLNTFPTGGLTPIGQGHLSYTEMFMTKSFWFHYTLPFVTIVFKLLYFPALMMRTSIVEVLGQDFIDYNRMRGLNKIRRTKHVMKHASLPVITLYPISMGTAIGGLVIVEMVFNWPGMGYTLVQAVIDRDYPIVQFVFFLIAVWIIIGNYVVDLLYTRIDPRVSVGQRRSQ